LVAVGRLLVPVPTCRASPRRRKRGRNKKPRLRGNARRKSVDDRLRLRPRRSEPDWRRNGGGRRRPAAPGSRSRSGWKRKRGGGPRKNVSGS
jgi:hypothetical protein